MYYNLLLMTRIEILTTGKKLQEYKNVWIGMWGTLLTKKKGASQLSKYPWNQLFLRKILQVYRVHHHYYQHHITIYLNWFDVLQHLHITSPTCTGSMCSNTSQSSASLSKSTVRSTTSARPCLIHVSGFFFFVGFFLLSSSESIIASSLLSSAWLQDRNIGINDFISIC